MLVAITMLLHTPSHSLANQLNTVEGNELNHIIIFVIVNPRVQYRVKVGTFRKPTYFPRLFKVLVISAILFLSNGAVAIVRCHRTGYRGEWCAYRLPRRRLNKTYRVLVLPTSVKQHQRTLQTNVHLNSTTQKLFW